MDIKFQEIEKRLSAFKIDRHEKVGSWSDKNPIIRGFASDSRKISADFVFFAIDGYLKHGANFISDAIKRGAKFIITDRSGFEIIEKMEISVAAIVVENPRKTLAAFAANWFNKQPKNQVAVTGTNGKTSVCHFVRQIWESLGLKAANVGTLGVQGEIELSLPNTTPDPILLHSILKDLAETGVENVSIEASSHGLDQNRLDEVCLTAAAYTNLSRDHLDYHIGEDDYLIAKCGLFDRILPEGQTVVVNIDDPNGYTVKLISENRKQKVITVGYAKEADIHIFDQRFYPDGQTIRFTYEGVIEKIDISLIGEFQAVNVLMAAALTIAVGSPANKVLNVLEKLESVPGRMQVVKSIKSGVNVFVDYAHTPDALQKALSSLKLHTSGKLSIVFGAGGDRDPGKRELMGKIAHEYADKIFITDDNPRNEPPANIRRQILKNCPDAVEIPDRAAAIVNAIENLRNGDVLLIAGKGHETGQIIGDDIFPFDDMEVASMAISLLNGKKI